MALEDNQRGLSIHVAQLKARHDVTSDVVNSWFVFHVGCIREGRSVLSRK